MRDQFTVQIAGNLETEPHRLALVSLPERWKINGPGGKADAVVAGSASKAGAAAQSGTSVVVVATPTSLTDDDIDVLLASAGNGVSIAVLPELAPRLKADPVFAGTEWSIIDSVAEVESADQLAPCLFEQLGAVRVLVGSVVDVNLVARTASHYVVSATMANGINATLTGVVTGIGRRAVSIDAVGTGSRLAVEIDLRATAHPAAITRFDDAGAKQSWPIYQSGLRLSWGSTAESLADGTDLVWTLRRVEQDLRTVNRLLRAGLH